MKCFGCKSKMRWQGLTVNTSWGDGPKIDVLVPGWQCSCCDYRVFGPYAVRVIQDEAEKVSRKT